MLKSSVPSLRWSVVLFINVTFLCKHDLNVENVLLQTNQWTMKKPFCIWNTEWLCVCLSQCIYSASCTHALQSSPVLLHSIKRHKIWLHSWLNWFIVPAHWFSITLGVMGWSNCMNVGWVKSWLIMVLVTLGLCMTHSDCVFMSWDVQDWLPDLWCEGDIPTFKW